MTAHPPAIIFDIGNVLVKWDPRFLYQKLISDDQELNWFLEHVVTLIWHTEHDRGLPMKDGIALLAAKYPKYAALIGLYDTRWHETIDGPIDGMPALVARLAAAQVPLFALSNFSAEKFSDFAKSFAPLRAMRDIIVSGEEGIVKPDPAIFALAERRFKVEPATCLFIDDREENIIGAKKAGFQTHLFIDAKTLEKELIVRGYL